MFKKMGSKIGDISAIDFSSADLPHWENGIHWPETTQDDRAVLFSRLYLEIGRISSSYGQYENALAAMERGLTHTGKDAPSLAQRARLPLKLAIAAALLEKGELEISSSTLIEIEPELDELRQPDSSVHWLEIAGKIDLLRGDF